MHREPADYLRTLCQSNEISSSSLRTFDTGLDGYSACNPVHAAQIKQAALRLHEHFGKKKPVRPLNNLLLGPAGSGKTFLAKQFGQVTDAELKSYNLSQFEHPGQIKACFDEIGDLLEKGKKVIGFFDEFDVRVGGLSAAQFLLQPMYDGTDGKGRELSRAAFIFSGSYLKDRHIFDSIGQGAEAFDFIGFLYDAFVHHDVDNPQRASLRDLLDVTMKFQPIRQQNLPTTNVLEYVRSLEKINDFASRINGFVVEVPDLSSPLNTTRQRFQVELQSKPVTVDPNMASQLIELVDGLRQTHDPERFLDYHDPYQPILEYKNLILMDRLLRAMSVLTRNFDPPIRVKRSLLNFLTVVPLVHGMRSLSSIIETLAKDSRGLLDFGSTSTDLLQRHIANFPVFRLPEKVWHVLKENNEHFAKHSREDDGDEVMIVK